MTEMTETPYAELSPVHAITEHGYELYELGIIPGEEPMICVGPGESLARCWTLTPESAGRLARAILAAAARARTVAL